MKIRTRYKKLTVWSKIGFWGSIASILGLFIWSGSFLFNINSQKAYIIISSFPSTQNMEKLYFDFSFFNGKKQPININEINLLCSENENLSPSSLLTWSSKKAFEIESKKFINKRVYFGRNKKDLMSTFSYYSGLPFYIGLRLIYINDNGESKKLIHNFGKLKIIGNMDGYTQFGGKTKIKLK